jgi:hypothetical protein
MAEDMILEVKKTVAWEIQTKINNRQVPDLIAKFLKGPWTEVMKIIGIRDGCQGRGWRTALKLVDDLIWSVQPKLLVNERRQLLSLIPEILQALKNGLMLIYYEQREIELFFAKLEKIHLSCMRIECSMKMDESATTVGTVGGKIKEQNTNDVILREIAAQSSKHEAFQSDITDPQLRANPYFETVQSMVPGTWVEFRHHHGIKRGKLAWKCDFTGEFTFLDRRFKVIADVALRELIRQFECGKARIVNEVPLIDRAMDVLLNGVKQYVGLDRNFPHTMH